jgi:hypothetical protein
MTRRKPARRHPLLVPARPFKARLGEAWRGSVRLATAGEAPSAWEARFGMNS